MGKKQTVVSMPKQTSTHLRDTRPGREHMVWGWTPELAVLPHMAPYNLPEEKAEVAEPKPESKPEPQAVEPEVTQPSRVPDIVAAIGHLGEGDFTKSGANAGAPKVDALTKLLDWKFRPVTGAERDEAWAIFQENKDAGQPAAGNA